MPDARTLDPARCPLCGAANGCAMEAARVTGAAQPLCWCMTADFDPAALARLPSDALGVACVCARCAAGATGAIGAIGAPASPTP